MAPIDRHSIVARAEALASAPMGEGLAVMNLERDCSFVLHGVGLDVWERIEAPARVADIAAALAADYEVGKDACEADVLRFLEQLREKALLVVL